MTGWRSKHMIQGVRMVGMQIGGRTGRPRNVSKALRCPSASHAINIALRRPELSSAFQNEGQGRMNALLSKLMGQWSGG